MVVIGQPGLPLTRVVGEEDRRPIEFVHHLDHDGEGSTAMASIRAGGAVVAATAGGRPLSLVADDGA